MRDLMARIAEEIPALRRYARCLLRDADSADDLVQDCLERALARRHLWRRGGSLRSWLFTILHNLHVNQQRNRRRRPMLVALCWRALGDRGPGSGIPNPGPRIPDEEQGNLHG